MHEIKSRQESKMEQDKVVYKAADTTLPNKTKTKQDKTKEVRESNISEKLEVSAEEQNEQI